MKKNRGFTLIEILVVMVVIGILAAIAVPSYQSQMRKGTRAAAQAMMMDMANKQQFYLQSQRQYTTDYTELGIAALPSEVTNFYTVTISTNTTATPMTFTINATPKTGTRQEADGWITLDSTGTKNSQYTNKW
jgi:type IV pilus assembly protein PilE